MSAIKRSWLVFVGPRRQERMSAQTMQAMDRRVRNVLREARLRIGLSAPFVTDLLLPANGVRRAEIGLGR